MKFRNFDFRILREFTNLEKNNFKTFNTLMNGISDSGFFHDVIKKKFEHESCESMLNEIKNKLSYFGWKS